MSDKGEVPRFQSEAEEAQWWFDHKEETARWMQQAAAEGRVSSLASIVERRRQRGTTPTVSIRIDPADLSRARFQAERRGLRYQTYLKMVLHEALEREERPSAAG
jgi:predicted DNA binding CopG/RHH family protein